MLAISTTEIFLHMPPPAPSELAPCMRYACMAKIQNLFQGGLEEGGGVRVKMKGVQSKHYIYNTKNLQRKTWMQVYEDYIASMSPWLLAELAQPLNGIHVPAWPDFAMHNMVHYTLNNIHY